MSLSPSPSHGPPAASFLSQTYLPNSIFFLTPKRRRRRRKTITPSRSLPRSDVKRHLHALHLWTLFRHGRPRSCWGVRRRPSSQDLSFFPALLRLTSERSWTQPAQSPSLALSPRPFIPSGNLISRPGPSPSAPNPWSGLPGALPFARLPSPFSLRAFSVYRRLLRGWPTKEWLPEPYLSSTGYWILQRTPRATRPKSHSTLPTPSGFNFE